MFYTNPYTGRKVIKHGTICLIIALATEKIPKPWSKVRGRKGPFDREHRAFSNSEHSVASHHFLFWRGYEWRVSKSSILWKLSSDETKSNTVYLELKKKKSIKPKRQRKKPRALSPYTTCLGSSKEGNASQCWLLPLESSASPLENSPAPLDNAVLPLSMHAISVS